MKFVYQIFLITIITINFQQIIAQKIIRVEKLKSNFAKGENKEKYYGNLLKNVEETFSKKFNGNSWEWNKALRNAQSILLKNGSVKNGISNVFKLNFDKYKKLQRTSLEIANTLYPKEYAKEIDSINKSSKDPISIAISTQYLLRNNYQNRSRNYYLDLIDNKFGVNPKYTIIKSLKTDILNEEQILPDLSELINHPFQKGKTIIYTFLRKDRNLPGITIIKKPNGKFERNDDRSLFYIPQLGLSFSNLPSYIPNGNTPQGIYSIVGWYISPTETIGPTPNVLIRSPFEVSTDIFYHGLNKNKRWNIEEYANLLPESWSDYRPIYNSFYAGKIGRRVIIMHGSTDETKYFAEKSYYPLTPTRGCLSSKEIWNEETGYCIESDQVKLINQFKKVGQSKGFLVVIEIDNQKIPIQIQEIEELLNINSPQR